MSDITIETPWRREPEALRDQFAAWFAHVLPAGSDPVVTGVDAPEGNGLSSETLLVDVEHAASRGGRTTDRFAARLTPAPGAYPVFPEYDLELQYRCIDVVREHTDVPVPDAPWYEPDVSWLGSPFLVMRRVDGAAPKDLPPYVFTGWLYDATPEQRTRASSGRPSACSQACTSSSPVVTRSTSSTGPNTARPPSTSSWRISAYYYEWAREGVTYPVVERLFDWSHANRPAGDGRTTITWGDSRIGNILYRDFEPVAVLDWEMAALGPAEVDVAWMIWMHRFFQEIAETYGMPGLPDFLGGPM